MGQGPMTGKSMGQCPVCGGTGKGMGASRRFWSLQKNGLQSLKAIEAQLEKELKDIKEEIASAEKQTK
jgi:hypothetical protein